MASTFVQIVEEAQIKLKVSRTIGNSELPIKGGRVSEPEYAGTIGGLLQEFSHIQPDFNLQLLGALETLAKYHPDLSYAIDNIKQLGNTSYSVYFDDRVTDKQSKEMMARIKRKSKASSQWYAYSGGINALINDLFTQLAIYGALSAEMVPELDLSGIKKTVLVPPKGIVFKYDKELDHYQPYQKIDKAILAKNEQMVALNTTTYKYFAIGRFGEKPYAIPPFLSALENIAIGRDMQSNLKYVVKKLGTLGFLEVLINGPKPKPNEDTDVYYNRTRDYLNKVIPEIEKGLARGFVAGFEGVHKFNMHNTSGSIQGSKELVDLNDTKMMAGLKQDPLMFGRSFNTSETLGRVIIAKMGTQIGNYQKTVASYLEAMYLTDLQLAGYPVEFLDVVFDPPMIGDKVREETARTSLLSNLQTLLKDGIIDIHQYAIEAGYEQPADPEKHIVLPNELLTPPVPQDTTGTDPAVASDATDPKTTENNIKELLITLGGNFPEYDYGKQCCNTAHYHFGKEDTDPLSVFIKKYFNATKQQFDAAGKKVVRKVAKALEELGKGASESYVFDTVVATMYKEWGTAFSVPQKKIVKKFIEEAYAFFRLDSSSLEGIEGLPKGVFDTIDFRVLEYYKKSDELYLGKFITDKDLKSKITAYIKETYLAGDIPVGTNKAAIKEFRAKFGTILEGQDWKIRRIIDTTVNMMRNTAVVNYMNQAEVTEFERVELLDNLTCAYCRELDGKKFSVTKQVDKINELVSTDPQHTGIVQPFVTSLFKKAEDMQGLTADQLQDKGVGHGPVHPHCRGQIVAVL